MSVIEDFNTIDAINEQIDYETRNYIVTFTGKKFYPFNPRPEDICIDDIAHALSNICRYTGHVHQFYSVAEHSLRAAKYASKNARLWALMHDAAEAYYMDLSRPIKHHPALAPYREAEAYCVSVIADKYALGPCPDEVKEIDTYLAATEALELLPGAEWARNKPHYKPRPYGHIPYTPGEAAYRFKTMFEYYGGKE